jgi:methyltransferase (TIGR00027 family)
MRCLPQRGTLNKPVLTNPRASARLSVKTSLLLISNSVASGLSLGFAFVFDSAFGFLAFQLPSCQLTQLLNFFHLPLSLCCLRLLCVEGFGSWFFNQKFKNQKSEMATSRRGRFSCMTADQPSIRHISDTARWAAVFRARETERPDALFRDPLARRLAGERGEEIARTLPFHEKNSWSWITRTWLFDRLISQEIGHGTDLVLNLAAGLDARPYRMSLPASLKWVEVDLPGIVDYKEEILRDEKPQCVLERVRMDLSDVNARRALLDRLASLGRRALVISEGLLIYLKPGEVAALAEDLAQRRIFQSWIVDIASPGLLEMIRKNTSSQIGEGAAQLQFAPENGPQFFVAHGWTPAEVHSSLKTAAHLKRLTLIMRLLSLLPEKPDQMGKRPWGGICLLRRTPQTVKIQR